MLPSELITALLLVLITLPVFDRTLIQLIKVQKSIIHVTKEIVLVNFGSDHYHHIFINMNDLYLFFHKNK